MPHPCRRCRLGSVASELLFATDSATDFATEGGLVVRAEGAERSGRWQLRPDASLELELADAGSDSTVLERIWFIKPNLRLRSTTAMAADGTPLQARFCSEIRRVSSPTD